MRRAAPLAVLLIALVTVACAPVDPANRQRPLGPPDGSKVRRLEGARGVVRFTACDRQSADPASTHLRALPLTPGPQPYDIEVPEGRVVLEHATDLVLTDGMLGSGSGFDVATASGAALVRVAPETVTAPVTLAVLDSPQAGRRVAFVEVRIHPDPPIRWDEEMGLHIGTDGGDGGFVTKDARKVSHHAIDDYVEAFYPGGDSGSGIVCVLRHEDDERPDGVMFNTGYGDGGYPTVIGRAADGRIVSVVSYGFVVPWRLSGLPGTPPREVVEQEQTRR
jgi:hypothetical protein